MFTITICVNHDTTSVHIPPVTIAKNIYYRSSILSEIIILIAKNEGVKLYKTIMRFVRKYSTRKNIEFQLVYRKLELFHRFERLE